MAGIVIRHSLLPVNSLKDFLPFIRANEHIKKLPAVRHLVFFGEGTIWRKRGHAKGKGKGMANQLAQ